MRRIVTGAGLALALGLSLLVGIPAQAAPGQVNVQGALRDATGALMEGNLTVTLRIFANQTGGSALWEETRTLAVSGGLFGALLPGDPTGNPFPATLFGTGARRWLAVQPQGQTELPRTPLVSVPYALHAGTAGMAGALDCEGCVTVTLIDPAVLDAALMVYDNLTSGLMAETAQAALDELSGLYAGIDAALAPVARSGAFSDLTGVPAGLADGDDDTLATLACATGQVAKKTPGGWACAADIDTKLTEAQVDSFVANNGFAILANLAAIATSGAWSDLTGVPATLLDGDQDTLGALSCTTGQVAKKTAAGWACAADSDTTLTEAQVDAFVANNGYALSSSLAEVATTGAFGDLVGVPAGLLDGDDDLLAGISCANGNVVKFQGGTWQCATDIDTKLTEAQVDAFVANNGYAVLANLAAIATSGSWNDLQNIPADIANGDADTLGALACAEGQIPKRQAGLWKCGADIDTKLSEAQVDAYVANNGYALAGDIATVGRTGRFSDLINVPAGLADGDQDTLGGLSCAVGQIAVRDATGWRCGDDRFLTEAQVDLYVANNGYASAASLAQVATTGQFSHLAGIPAGLANGDDDTLATLSCASGQVPKWSGSHWACGDDIAGGGGGGAVQDARSFYVVLALRANTFCPSGYTQENVTNISGPNNYIHTMISEHGISFGGSNGPSYGYEHLYGRFHTTHGISTVCWKRYTSSSGNPHVSMMAVAGGGAGTCPSGYHYIPRSHTVGNNSWGYAQANDAGMYLGYIDSWGHGAHGYEDSSGYQQWHWTTHVDTICFRVYGVDEDPATAAGVYPVFLGLRNLNECPSGWNRAATSALDRTDGYFFIMANPNASFLGGHYSWGHGGNQGQYIQYHNSHVFNTCWKYFVRNGPKPSYVVKNLRSGACPSGYLTFSATNVKGWNNHGYMQANESMLYLGGLYAWSVFDHSAGYQRHTWTDQLANRVCLKMDNVL